MLKKVYSSKNPIQNTIDITFVFSNDADYVADMNVAAANFLDPQMDSNKKFTKEQIRLYQDYILSVESMVAARFKITYSKQSKWSYSYYIEFEVPVDDDAEVELWKIRFRISNHEPSDKSFSKSNERRFIFRCITLGNNEIFESSFQSLRVIANTLDRLEAGDLEAVMQMDFHDNSTDFEWERGV